MPSSSPLDLAELDPPIWHVQVGEETYGPYTLGQMQAFISEGRVTGASRIAEDETALFRNARDIAALALYLPEEAPIEVAAYEEPTSHQAVANNFVIVSRGPDGELPDTRRTLSQALNAYGPFAESLPGVFVLRSENRLADIRAHLEQVCAPRSQILIVEAHDGRLGWLGLPDDSDRHIRSVWNAKLD
jgi:hypothetical protein